MSWRKEPFFKADVCREKKELEQKSFGAASIMQELSSTHIQSRAVQKQVELNSSNSRSIFLLAFSLGCD